MTAASLFFSPILEVAPIEALIDQGFSLSVSSLQPHAEILFRSQTVDEEGHIWSAALEAKADEKGRFSLADGSSLVWAMESPSSGRLMYRPPEVMKIGIGLEVNQLPVARKEIVRWKKNSAVSRISVRERGLVGTLFVPPSKTTLAALVVLGGSSGGINEDRAMLLASHGYAALSLAYFGAEHLPKTLKNIPLEYCEQAIQFLKNRPEIDPDRIGLWGVSRGGELALLTASFFADQVKVLVAYVPSSVAYGSLDEDEAPAWTYRGKAATPNAQFRQTKFDLRKGKTASEAISLMPAFLDGLAESGASAIPVEQILAPLLIISAQDDQMWPSCAYGEKIMERLQGSSIPHFHYSYPGAGHFISPPLSPSTAKAQFHPIFKLWFAIGGNPSDNAWARRDSWGKTLQFLKEFL